jgi:hypothetical protein
VEDDKKFFRIYSAFVYLVAAPLVKRFGDRHGFYITC